MGQTLGSCFGCVSELKKKLTTRFEEVTKIKHVIEETKSDNTGELTKKGTFFVLLHIRGFIWNRGQTILLYAIECDTLSFSLAVKIPDFGH